MTVSLYSLVSDAKALLDLEPEGLAGVLMEHLNLLGIVDKRSSNDSAALQVATLGGTHGPL